VYDDPTIEFWEVVNLKHKASVWLCFGICVFFAVVLVVLVCTFPRFFHWFYVDYHGLSFTDEITAANVRTVTWAFYLCAPFAGAALYCLISLMWELLHARVFTRKNVRFLSVISWCCLAVLLVTGFFGLKYVPLFIITLAMGVVGILVRVVQSVMDAAVTLREENDLTI
jgi:hypothetical protein